jgi:hypothetical protein
MEIMLEKFLINKYFYLLTSIDIYDLADEQRTMEMAEQYSNRRIMVIHLTKPQSSEWA